MLWKTEFIRLYQKKSGWTDFDELWETVSTLNKGTNSLVMSSQTDGLSCVGAKRDHKICNGWFTGLVALISSIVGILILYSKNVLGQVIAFVQGLQGFEWCYV